MHEIVVPALYGLSGIMVYAAAHHVLGALSQPSRAQWLFACMCLLVVPLAIFYRDMVEAATVDSYARALKWNLAGPMLFFMLFPWFIAAYTGDRALRSVAALSAIFALLFVVNLAQPYSVQYESISALRPLVLPWGETLQRATGPLNAWVYVAVGAIVMAFAYALYALGRTYVSSRRGADLAMIIAMAVFLLSVIQAALTRLSVIESVELGPFGFLPVVLVMSAALSFGSRARLQASEERFRALVEQSPFSIQILAPDGSTKMVNSAWEKLWGIRLEQLGSYNIRKDAQLAAKGVLAYIENGLAGEAAEIPPVNYSPADNPEVNWPPSDRWVRAYIYPIKNRRGVIDDVVLMHEDITEKRQAELSLQESEERFRTIVQQSPVGISFSRDGVTLGANDAFLKMHGYTKASEIAGTNVLDRIAPQCRQEVAARIQRRAQGVGIEATYETTGLRKDGTQFPMIVSASRVMLSDGPVTSAFVTDITDRVRAVEVEKRLLRTVTLLSRCNALIARAPDEQALLEGACKLAVDVGGYLMAWFGMPQDDGTVKPVARSGYENGYLESIRITSRDEPEGRGPTGSAIRTGKTVVMQDILNNPLMMVWHESARRRGYHSSVAFPLLLEQRVMGVLTIYSTERNAFGGEELRLLEELVSDLAFGLAALRARKDKEAALQDLKVETEKNLALLRTASEGIHVLDAEGTIIEVNDAFCEMLAYRRDEVIGMNVSHWEGVPYKLEPPSISLQDRLSRNVHSTYETQFRAKDGHVIDVEVRSFPLILGGKLVLFNSWRDITANKAAFHALRESEQKLRALYELSPLGIALRELNGPYVDFNDAYRAITGYDAAELKILDNWKLTPPEYVEAESRQIEALTASGRYGPYEKEYIRKDGVRIPVRLSGALVKGKDGRNYVWSIVEDISESRRSQREIESAAEQLRSLVGNYESTLEAERAHIAREVHDELGQTLTSLRFEIAAMRLGADRNNATLTEIINTMSSLTDHAIHVTRNVAENLRPVAMNMGIVPAIEWLCSKFTANSGVRYQFSVTGEFEDMVQSQVDVLFRIAQESLTNVLRHSHAKNVSILLAARDGAVQMRIADDGAGFDLGEPRRPKSFGLLGMQERAAMMGGNVDIQSAPGRGTVVTVKMPYRALGEEP